MKRMGIDAHIHLDMYETAPQKQILDVLPSVGVKGLVAVSMNLSSCLNVQNLHRQFPNVIYPAYGFHPEQPISTNAEIDELFKWIAQHQEEMVAIGEVGLPYYTRTETEGRGEAFDLEPYISLLERFVQLAVSLNKPVVLHAVYEDAEIACNILERNCFSRAHFHWYKGSEAVTERMMRNGYYISVTPDVLYEAEIQKIVSHYPLQQMMVETDGPWPFEGPFLGQETHPRMIFAVIDKIAQIKSISKKKAEQILLENTMNFYHI